MGAAQSNPKEKHTTQVSSDEFEQNLSELRAYLTRTWQFVDNVRELLQKASSIKQVVPNVAEVASDRESDVLKVVIYEITQLMTKLASDEEPVSSNINSIEDALSGRDVCNVPTTDVMTLKTKLEQYKKQVDDCYNSIQTKIAQHTMKYVQNYKPKEPCTNPNGVTEKSSQGMKTNLEEGRRVPFQIHISKNANLPNHITDSFLELLRRDISNKYRNGVTLDPCFYDTHQLNYHTLPLIVFCPVDSRIGASVDDALKEVKTDEKSILLMLHHVARHEINILSSTRKLTLPESTKLGCILDMVFHRNDGIHICKQNDDTVARITKFIVEYK